MATILGLALKVSADASGVQKSLTPVQKAIQQLDTEAKKVTDSFKQFEGISSGAGAAQQRFATDLAFLNSALRTGQIDARQYAEEFAALGASAKATAEAFAEGVLLTEQNRTAEESRNEQLQRLEELLELGAISQETFNRAAAEASGANKAAAEAEAQAAKVRADAVAEAARITESVVTEQEKRQASLARLGELLSQGLLSEETYQRAVEKTAGASGIAAEAEKQRQALLDEAKRVTESVATEEEKRAAKLASLRELLDANAISQETFNRASAEASGANAAAAESAAAAARIQADAERERAQAVAEAARIIKANATPQERYDAQILELSAHLTAGRLTQEQYNRAVAKARADLDKVSVAASTTDESIQRLSASVGILTSIEVGRVLIDGFQFLSGIFTQVSGQVKALVGSVNTSIDQLNDFSARTGFGVESLQAYSLAAKLAGVDAQAFGATVQKLSVNIGQANPGDAFDKSLRGIGLTVAELKALAPEQQFSRLGEAISKLPTAADRAAAAVQLFGKQGAALAPLFREGAASLEELQERAEKLGIIISDTQINNVAEMNDAFDLVRSTVEGIVGQVIGNLAPAVTDVTNQFLKFVEEFNGGEGGNGIANAITDVLLEGAEYFAGIFDQFVAEFGDLGEIFSYSADIFDVVSKVLLTASEGLRAAFNAIQLGIDALLAGFGKIIESIGSYVSDDLEQFGAGLAAASQESAERNSREMEAAAANAANTFNSIFTGGDGNAQQAGKGAASQYLSGLRSEIENARLPEIKVQANLKAATADLDQFLSTAEGGSSVFLEQSQATLATFSKMAAEGQLTADQIKIMDGFMKSLNSELTKEKKLRNQATEAAEIQTAADRKRLEQLLGTSDEASKLEQDLLAVQREQARVSGELAAARDSSDREAANSAAARLAQLDQLRSKLEDQSAAINQGFSDGFSSAFRKTAEELSGLVDQAGKLGQAGVAAGAKLQEGVAKAQKQAEAGIITKDVYDRELAAQKKLFEERVAQIEKIRELEKQNREAIFKAQIDANERVNQFLTSRMTEQQRAEIASADAVAKRKQEAQLNIEAIKNRLVTEETALQAARDQNDLKSARAGQARIDELEKALRIEEKIAEGKTKDIQQQQQLAEYQRAYQEQQLAAANAYQQQQQKAQEAYAQEQAKIFEEQQKAAAEEAKRQEERLEKLNTLGSTTIKSQDVRSTEGANLVLQTIASGQDPALIQQRLQTKYLEAIALGIGQASSNYFNQPVAIVGYSSFGQQR